MHVADSLKFTLEWLNSVENTYGVGFTVLLRHQEAYFIDFVESKFPMLINSTAL